MKVNETNFIQSRHSHVFCFSNKIRTILNLNNKFFINNSIYKLIMNKIGKLGNYTLTSQLNDKTWEALKTVYDENTGEAETEKYIIKKVDSHEMDAYVKLIELSKITLSRIYIAPIIDVVEDDSSSMFIVTEFVHGKSMKDIIESSSNGSNGNSNNYNLILKYMNDIAEAVDYIHRNGISHGNIKPSNIILDEELNKLRLVDFDKSCIQNSDCNSRGELYYSPPEISHDFKGEKAHDMWSTGVVFYQLANNGENYINFTNFEPDTIKKDIEYLPVNASKNNYNPINNIISLLLEKNSSQRIDSSELIASLQISRPGCEINNKIYSRSEGEALLIESGKNSNIVESLDSEICKLLTSELYVCQLNKNRYNRKELVKIAQLLDIEFDSNISGKNLCNLIEKNLESSDVFKFRATGDLVNILDVLSKIRGESFTNLQKIFFERYSIYKNNNLIDIEMLKEIQADSYSRYLSFRELELELFMKQAAFKNNELVEIILDFQPEIEGYKKFLVV